MCVVVLLTVQLEGVCVSYVCMHLCEYYVGVCVYIVCVCVCVCVCVSHMCVLCVCASITYGAFRRFVCVSIKHVCVCVSECMCVETDRVVIFLVAADVSI